jgi:BASS family bile acid:Na+ symporter
MGAAIEIALPLLIVLAMVIVGLELTPADLARVLRFPMQIAVGLVGQVLVLPLLAASLIVLLRPETSVAGGLILAAAAPQAMSSNFFTLLGRANVALSVTLTACSSVLALAATPLIAKLGFALLLEREAGLALPVGPVMLQVVIGLILPVAAGMLVRRFAPAFVQRNHVRFQRMSLAALGALLILILVDQAATIQRNLWSIALLAVLFTLGAGALGWSVARAFAWTRTDAVTLVVALPSRSLSIAALVAINVLGRTDFLAFAAPFFVVQSLMLLPVLFNARPSAAAS